MKNDVATPNWQTIPEGRADLDFHSLQSKDEHITDSELGNPALHRGPNMPETAAAPLPAMCIPERTLPVTFYKSFFFSNRAAIVAPHKEGATSLNKFDLSVGSLSQHLYHPYFGRP